MKRGTKLASGVEKRSSVRRLGLEHALEWSSGDFDRRHGPRVPPFRWSARLESLARGDVLVVLGHAHEACSGWEEHESGPHTVASAAKSHEAGSLAAAGDPRSS